MCQIHWEKLQSALNSRGLNILISKDSKVAVDSFKRFYEGGYKYNKTDFDPLIDAYFKISIAVIHLAPDPSYLSFTKEDGSQYCPICEVYEHRNDNNVYEEYVTDEEFDDFWFEQLANSELEIARNLGLVPKVN